MRKTTFLLFVSILLFGVGFFSTPSYLEANGKKKWKIWKKEPKEKREKKVEIGKAREKVEEEKPKKKKKPWWKKKKKKPKEPKVKPVPKKPSKPYKPLPLTPPEIERRKKLGIPFKPPPSPPKEKKKKKTWKDKVKGKFKKLKLTPKRKKKLKKKLKKMGKRVGSLARMAAMQTRPVWESQLTRLTQTAFKKLGIPVDEETLEGIKQTIFEKVGFETPLTQEEVEEAVAETLEEAEEEIEEEEELEEEEFLEEELEEEFEVEEEEIEPEIPVVPPKAPPAPISVKKIPRTFSVVIEQDFEPVLKNPDLIKNPESFLEDLKTLIYFGGGLPEADAPEETRKAYPKLMAFLDELIKQVESGQISILKDQLEQLDEFRLIAKSKIPVSSQIRRASIRYQKHRTIPIKDIPFFNKNIERLKGLR